MANFYKLLFLFLLFSGMPAAAQTVWGHVYNEANEPIEGVVVYVDGTTLSSTTNGEGFFSITATQKMTGQLVVRSMGYKPLRIDDPFGYGKPLKIILEPEAIEMKAAVIEGKTIFSRKEMLRAFREQFLGTSGAGRSCKIENEDDIWLRFDTSTNTLYAEAGQPLRIVNNRLKYIITFDLIASEIRYRKKSLEPYFITGAFFGGTTLFSDISENGNADKRRKEAYLGSPMHFIKTIVNEDWDNQKFELFNGSLKANPNKHLTISDTLGIKKIIVTQQEPAANITMRIENTERRLPQEKKQRFEILYNKKEQSFFMYNSGTFYANTNGLFWPLHELTFGGYMGDLRMGDLLPSDYRYE